MPSIFMAIPSYADPELPRTVDSAIRASSGSHPIRVSVAEQVTRYGEAYRMGRLLDEHVDLHIASVGERLIGLGGARQLAESRYAGEDLQVQVDSHARFEADWDVYLVELVDQLGSDAIISQGSWSNPWTDADKVPVCELDRMEGGIPAGHVAMVEPSSGRVDEAYPARTVLGGAIAGRSWCAEVPADPHILFGGEEPCLAARLWTNGRSLTHARLPWYQPIAGEDRPGGRAWLHPDWAEMDATSQRRVQALLTGSSLPDDDPAGLELEEYGLGSIATLADWLAYSGLDYQAGTVKTPWP